MLNEKDSKELAMALLYSTSSEEVIAVLNNQKYKTYFSNLSNWAPYGGRDKNWDAAGNQQSNGVGALVENVVNGLDHTYREKWSSFDQALQAVSSG